jgi:probable blue pigment (indigoidine) exporter
MMVVATVLTKKWGRPPGVGPLEFTGWTFLLGGLVLLPFMLVIEGLPTHLTARNVAGYLYVIVFGAVISYSLWFWCLERLPASAASFLSLINPVFAAILGWIVLDQSLNGTQLFGAVLVLVSVALGQTGALGRRPAGVAAPSAVVTTDTDHTTVRDGAGTADGADEADEELAAQRPTA